MHIRKILSIVFLALSMPLPGQQLDKPVGSEDLVDQKTAAENSYAAETSRIDDTERALRTLVGRDIRSSSAEGSATQILILRCVSDHDYYMKLEQIYASAEQAADQIIRDLEAHTDTASSTARAIEVLQKQLDATLHREADLQANASSSNSDDLEEQKQIEKKLREAIGVYQSLPAPNNSEQANRMRAMKEKFSLLGQDAGDLVKIAETKCIAERQVLYYLDQRARREEQIQAWGQLLSNGEGQDQSVNQTNRKPLPAPPVVSRQGPIQ